MFQILKNKIPPILGLINPKMGDHFDTNVLIIIEHYPNDTFSFLLLSILICGVVHINSKYLTEKLLFRATF